MVGGMTSLLDRNSTVTGERSSLEPDRPLPTRPRSKRPLLAAASAAVVVVSIAAFMSLYSSARHQQQVLVVTQPVEKGEMLSAADLGEASANLSGGVEAIPVSLTASVSGKRAAVTIPAGSLLVPGDLTSASEIPQGEAVVGIALKDGQYPSTGLQPGDQVMVVQTASPGSPLPTVAGGGSSTPNDNSGATASSGVLVPQATVFAVATPGTNSGGSVSDLVSVEVPTTLAAAVSTASAADQASLVLLPDVGSGATTGESANAGGGSK